MTIPAGPRLLETHVSTIFAVGERVYKLKKPLKTGFLDFSTREARLKACRDEVAINRRFSPDVYLGVADVIGPDGVPCDHLVVMRRMPDDRRLANLAREGGVARNDIEELARRVAETHGAAPRSERISRDASRDAVRGRWTNSFTEIRPFAERYLDPQQLEMAESLAYRYLAGRDLLFERRIADGKIVEGHGDLLADDIYLLKDGPRILDAIEFDERLRHVDVIDDVAFLAMDLERLGAPELSRGLLEAYMQASGDLSPRSLVDHYIAYRALVRAKVACMRADQGDTEAAIQAHLLLRLSVEHLVSGRVSLVLIGGLPGSGKSTIAQALAGACDYRVLNSDVVRKELAGVATSVPDPSSYRKGIYSKESTNKTYAELLNRAKTLIEQGVSVVLDASWVDSRHRHAAAELAVATSADLVEFHLNVPKHEAKLRMIRRSKSGPHVSDATTEIAAHMAKRQHPWPSAIEIDTQDSVEKVLEKMIMATSVGDEPQRPRHQIQARSA